jgi:hypothetical protein
MGAYGSVRSNMVKVEGGSLKQKRIHGKDSCDRNETNLIFST